MLKDLKIWLKKFSVFTFIILVAGGASTLYLTLCIWATPYTRQAEYGNRLEHIAEMAGQALRSGIRDHSMIWEILPDIHHPSDRDISSTEQIAEGIPVVVVWTAMGEGILLLLSLACAAWVLSTGP